jgi:4-hydroxy-2-oxoheptanedioate aldolase
MSSKYYEGGSAPLTMRPSRVLERLRAGKVASVFKINLDSARVAEVAAMQGYDCIWSDVEHTAADWSLIEKQINAAKCHNADVMVRVRRGSYSEYSVPLELDAAGLMVPHIMSLDDAKAVVRATRFYPLGRRALDGGNADGAYCNIGMQEYIKTANEQRFIAIQIEDPEPLEQLEEIAALPGYDILFFGPGDFSHAIGEPGNMAHPSVIEARERIAEAAIRHGKFAGTVGSPANIDSLVDLGYRFIGMGADVLALNDYCAKMLEEYSARNARLV